MSENLPSTKRPACRSAACCTETTHARPLDLAPLLRFTALALPSKTRRLSRANTIWGLRATAQRRTPQAPFDYTDGAAEAETSLRRVREPFLDLEFRPGGLRNVSAVDLIAHLHQSPHPPVAPISGPLRSETDPAVTTDHLHAD